MYNYSNASHKAEIANNR